MPSKHSPAAESDPHAVQLTLKTNVGQYAFQLSLIKATEIIPHCFSVNANGEVTQAAFQFNQVWEKVRGGFEPEARDAVHAFFEKAPLQLYLFLNLLGEKAFALQQDYTLEVEDAVKK